MGQDILQPLAPGSVAIVGSIDVADRPARQVGEVSVAALPLPPGAATEATLAARLAEATFTGRLPPALAAGDAIMNPTATQILAMLHGWDPVAAAWKRADLNPDGSLQTYRSADLSVTVTGGANAIATATLPAAGAGLFHYITGLSIRRVATAALAGGAILTVTTTNLGGRAWRTGNQASITVATFDGGVLLERVFANPLKSAVANTPTTIVCPAAGAAVSWHVVVDYFTAP